MTDSFSRWESDPLFSAAEVVQDSADRMDSIFRTLLHEQSIVQEVSSKLFSPLQSMRRDLKTVLETTRWQLEDFEREVNLAAVLDKSNSRENAILKYRQFIRSIREQILLVEKNANDFSEEDSSGNPPWMNLNEQEKVMLTSFLSGGNVADHIADYDTRNSIMRRFLSSTADNNEIIEVEPEEVEIMSMTGGIDADSGYASSRNHDSWKIGSNKHGKGDFVGQHEDAGRNDLEIGGSGKYYTHNKRTRRSIWGLLRNYWLGYRRKGSLIKRRKDGDITCPMENREKRMSSSISNQQGTILECLVSSMHLSRCIEVVHRKLQRSKYLILYHRFPQRFGPALLVILIVVGLLLFWMA